MREAIERAQTTEYTLIALLGHPGYYPRFGFAPPPRPSASPRPTTRRPRPGWRSTLPAYGPQVKGTFRYARAFPAG